MQSEIVWEFFLAHSGADKAAAETLYDLLKPHSKVFLDVRCLMYGDDWDLELTKAQLSSLITVVLVSSQTDEAYYQREEIATAIDQSRKDRDRHRVVPVYLDGLPTGNVPYGLRLKHGLSVREIGGLSGTAELLLELLNRLKGEDHSDAHKELSKEKFDTMLNYSSIDRPLVLQLATLLQQAGIKVWFDIWNLAPGSQSQEAMTAVSKDVKTAVVCVGPSGIGPWQEQEARGIIENLLLKQTPVIPVLLPGTPSNIDLPLFLRGITWVDLRTGLSHEGINNIIWGITGQRPPSVEGVGETRLVSEETNPSLEPAALENVFRTVGLPEYTYIEPRIYRHVAQALQQSGKHVIIEGPSGSGKTCMIFRILRELGYRKDTDFCYLSAASESDLIEITTAVQSTSHLYPLTIIDDFHFLPVEVRTSLAKRLKVLSDEVFTSDIPPKFLLIGIPSATQGLTFKIHDLGPRLGVYKMPPATTRQLSELISEGEKRLLVKFPRSAEIINESNNSFYLCQYICYEICFRNNVQGTGDIILELGYRIAEVRDYLMEDLNNRYQSALLTFLKKAGPKMEQKSGYLSLIRVLGEAAKPVVHLGEVIGKAGIDGSQIQQSKKQIRQNLYDRNGDSTLGQLLHYDEQTEIFSIEDPTFHYYLRHLNHDEVASAIGFFPGLDTVIIRERSEAPIEVTEEALRDSEESSISSRNQVFISYSHRDAVWLDQLKTMLAPVVRSGIVNIWSDTQVRTGAKWYEEIQRAISFAKVAVLLVSADFLASDFIATHELPVLLDQARSEGLVIVWIAVSASMVELTEIANYQAAHDPSRPLDTLAIPERNRVLVQICERIRDLLAT